ncbi:MAG: hypothetical protein LBI33_01095, partial [Propionibacteriaceae bacterium]|nr:hypothetical protein [Propionibacteriaceae bacterium]
MNPAVIRLAVLRTPGAWQRLAAIAAGIAVGVAMLLTLLGANAGLHARDTRTEWTNAPSGYPEESLTADTVLRLGEIEVVRGQPVTILTIAVTPDTHIRLPGGLPVPATGHAVVSPALAALIASLPGDQLGDRFGEIDGELPPTTLAGPDMLAAIRVADAATLGESPRTQLFHDLNGEPAYSLTGAYQTVMVIGAIALVIPVILLVSIVTALGAVQRRERLQTLRLIGATPRDVVTITAVEMAVTAALGAVFGTGLFWALRPLAAQIVVSGTRFYVSDLVVGWGTTFVVGLAVVAASVVAAAVRVSRDGIGPLGASRQLAERPPRARRLIPIGVGTALIALGGLNGDVVTRLVEDLGIYLGTYRLILSVTGFVLVSIGILASGPWLVRQASRWLSRRAPGAGSVIAASWFRRHPAAAFRSVAGLVIALYVTTVFAGLASVINQQYAVVVQLPGLMPGAIVAIELEPGEAVAYRERLDAIAGVEATVLGYGLAPGYADLKLESNLEAEAAARGLDPAGLSAALPAPVVVPAAGAATLGFAGAPDAPCVGFDEETYTRQWGLAPAPLLPSDCGWRDIAPYRVLYVATDGTTDALERVRTAVAAMGTRTL